MRYTEARMNKLSVEMVRDLDKDTVNFVDNYDGTEKEPEVLPSRFPNLLVNGSEGIAVGMATNMPPHNLSETIDAVIAIAKNPALTPLEIMQNYLHGPDFPTGGVILGRKGILGLLHDRHRFGHDSQQIPHRRRRKRQSPHHRHRDPLSGEQSRDDREYGPTRPRQDHRWHHGYPR
jgi:hypothetical protein